MYFDKELTIFPSDKNLLWEKEGYLNVIAFNLVKEQFCFLPGCFYSALSLGVGSPHNDLKILRHRIRS